MRNLISQNTPHMLAAIIGCVTLTACGGGNAPDAQTVSPAPAAVTEAAPVPVTTAAQVESSTAANRGSRAGLLLKPTVLVPTTVAGSVITDVRFESTGAASQSGMPVTFGQVFAAGDVQENDAIVGRLPDGTMVPLQVDIKARHRDGSLRHAVISAVLPSLAGAQTQTMMLVKTESYAPATSATPAALLSTGFTAAARITLAGQQYTASADELLKSGKGVKWLTGAIANEWLVSAPLKTTAGVSHPHLTARFAIRNYSGSKKTRVDVTIENNWAYEAAPQNFTYDAEIMVGGQPVFAKAGLTHYHHARWRKMFWWGDEPQVHIRHNTAYLIDSKAVPNYDRTIVINEAALEKLKTSWTGTKIEPMGVGLANPYMPSTGGRRDIGLMPGWSAMYLLSMDKRAKDVMLGTADLAGSWSAHFRDKNTDRPVSLIDYPYMTILGRKGDTKNPVTKLYEEFPACATSTACSTPYKHDSSHQPGFAYLPYVVTGDYYYIEELQFWAMWNAFSSNPGYRSNIKGLMSIGQVRGQAWSMRTAAEATYISPDADPLKAHLNYFLSNTLDWYNATYVTNSATSNVFGVLAHSGAVVYSGSTGVAPWQDDFFTAAVGRAAELGFETAQPLLVWKSKFPIARMSDPVGCWIVGASYKFIVRASITAPMFSSFAEGYDATNSAGFRSLQCGSDNMAAALKLKKGEMTGYSSSNEGFPSNLQPALAYAANAAPGGAAAWAVFASRTVKPDYSSSPQFAVVPR